MNLLRQATPLVVAALVLGTAACNQSSTDAAITTRVKHAFSKEAALKGTKVAVSTEKNVVHLSGAVQSRAERATLIAVARKVDGVKGVKTDLVVQGAEPKTAAKPQRKPGAQARAKPRETPAQRRVMHQPDLYGR
jgi:hypothetical protein